MHNVIVSNSIFADNDNSIDIDRADEITVENTVIIGESDSFKDLQARQNTESVCRQNRVMGIDLHTWKMFKEYGGATIRNVTLSGFTDTVCPNPSAIWFDTFVSGSLCRFVFDHSYQLTVAIFVDPETRNV